MGHKLLLADDSVTIQRVIELTFAEEDVQVLAVGDGKHAIDRIQADRPDIVLADVGMPERDGYEVAAFVKSQPQLAHIPVLLLTGAFEPIDETRARAVGCDGVLVKPFEPQMVINRVKDLLAGRKAAHTESTAQQSEPAAPELAGLASHPPNAKAADSLEDYFDRLDAAFATLGADADTPPPGGNPGHATAPPSSAPVASSRPATVEDFASWDPELAGDAHRPAANISAHSPVAAPVAPPPVPQTLVSPPVAVAPQRASTHVPAASAIPAPQISLAEAFASLLAAEHGQPVAPKRLRNDTVAPSAEIVEDIVKQVLERLGNEDVRQTVVEIAERLVREELDRIKRSNA